MEIMSCKFGFFSNVDQNVEQNVKNVVFLSRFHGEISSFRLKNQGKS